MSTNGPDDQRDDRPGDEQLPPPPPPAAPPPGSPGAPPPGQAGGPTPPGGAWGPPPPPHGSPQGGWGGQPPPGTTPGAAPGAPTTTPPWDYGPPPGYGPPPPEGGVLDNAVRIITAPVDTLRRLTHHPRIGWSIGIVVVVALLSALSGTAAFDTTPVPDDPFAPGFDFGALRGIMLVAGAIFGPLFSLLFLVIWAAILHGLARLFKGTGTFAGTFTGVSFAYVVTVFAVPFQLLPLVIGPGGSVLAGVVGFGLFIWSLVLDVIAVRECHGISTGRAVAAVLIPIGVFILLAVLLVVLIIVLVMGGLAGLMG